MVKNLPANAGDASSIPSSGRSSGERNVYLLQYSCLLNLMDGGAYGLKSLGSQRDSVNNSPQHIAMAPHKVSERNIWQRRSA